MMRIDDLVEAIADLQRADLEDWLRQELISARREQDTLCFSDSECARVRLISTLRYELDVDTDTLPMVLSLVDQLYETRQRLLSLGAAVARQDRQIQDAIMSALRPPGPSSGGQ